MVVGGQCASDDESGLVVVPVRGGHRRDALSEVGSDAPQLVPGGCSCCLRGVKIAVS